MKRTKNRSNIPTQTRPQSRSNHQTASIAGNADSGHPARALVSGLDPASARNAIILSEIIGQPLSKRRRSL